MNKMFTQPTGPVAKETNKEAIARIFGLKKSQVSYISPNAPVDNYTVLFDKGTQTCWYRDVATGTPVTWGVDNKELNLVTTEGTFVLNRAYSGDWVRELLSSGDGANSVNLRQENTVQETVFWVSPKVAPGEVGTLAQLNEVMDRAVAKNLPIYIPPNVFLTTAPWIIPDNVKVFGVNGKSIIRASDSFEDAVLKSKNAPVGDYLTVNEPTAMVQSICLEDITVEGSWDGTATNTTSQTECVRIYGAGTIIKGLRVGYCRGMGANLGGRGVTSTRYGAPSIYEDIRVDMVGQHGITIGGSSDNHSSKIIVRNAGLIEHNTYDGIRFGGGGGTRADQFHVWQSGDSALTPLYQNRVRYGLYLASYDSLISNCHFEGCASAQICFVGARNSVINTRCYSNYEAGGTAVLFLNDANFFSGFIGAPMNNVAANLVHAFTFGVSGGQAVKNCMVDAYVYGCKFLNFVNSSGRHKIAIRGDLAISGASGVGTIVTGSIDATDLVELNSPQYTALTVGMNVNLQNTFTLSGRDITASGNLSGAVLNTTGQNKMTGLTVDVPTETGVLYRDSNGNVKVKL